MSCSCRITGTATRSGLLLLPLLLRLIMMPVGLRAFSMVGRRAAVHYSIIPSCIHHYKINRQYTNIIGRLYGTSISNDKMDDFERGLTEKQKATSSNVKSSTDASSDADVTANEEAYNNHQAQVFNEMSSWFASPESIPDNVVPILEEMTEDLIAKALQQRADFQAENEASRPARAKKDNEPNVKKDDTLCILDVGCGTGVLFSFYLEAANNRNVNLHIHGLDLAPSMVERAQNYATKLLEKIPGDHSIIVEVGDIGKYQADDIEYDLVVANSCFANFWAPAKALRQMASHLKVGGMIFITHPLGSQFVQKLHEQDATTVPHLLPTTMADFQKLSTTLPLHHVEIVDQPASSYYTASAVKTTFRALPQIMRLRGNVDSGYGRGGKKLGFPTANLPSRLFQGALEDVPCGVYFGWAVLEDSDDKKKGRNVAHKAVVNVGLSPTFEGKENPEKVVEAHLMFSDNDVSPLDPPDFYGEVMRLQLHGFIRSEIKFPSFPDLIAQITTDVADAKDALDLDIYSKFLKDPFIADVKDGVWVGSSGGDKTASWDFEDVEFVLERL